MANRASLNEVAEGVFCDSDPVSIAFMALTTTMTVLSLRDGTVLVYSPVRLTEERRAAVEALGSVAHLYAPSAYHHRYVADWARAFPSARVHAPGALRKKQPDLRIDRIHGSEPEPAFEGLIDEVLIRGCRLKEAVLVYRPARVLLVADLVHNVGRPEGAWSRFYTKTMGFYDRVALSRVLRWTAFPDRGAARSSIDEVLALPFDRIVVGHGAPIVQDAKQALEAAYSWLG
jgi:hypothetical protein